ncbi:MAG: CDP-alcohol phosphatidyltransferase family protein [Actinobacteria bacterium]|nr:CDP-alcohol phosphatidyltransferase family protein [Actinomycetota bacterium]
MFDGRFRANAERTLKPVGQQLKRTGITADHLTVLGVVMAVAAAFAIGQGALRLGLLLLVLTALPDVLDGAVAKASGMASSRGAFFDSVADRFTDALLLGGVAWYLADTEGGRLPLLPMAVLAASMLISYERAKAEALGYNAKGGLMERAERLIALGLGLLFDQALVAVLWIMLALTVVTAIQRFVKVWKQATAATPVLANRPTMRTRARNRQADRRVARSTQRQVRRRSPLRPPR